jgi:hypothetical protein
MRGEPLSRFRTNFRVTAAFEETKIEPSPAGPSGAQPATGAESSGA